MNDLGTDVEHMDRRYLWRPNKRGQRVHILDFETGRTFCQVENCGGKPFDSRGQEIPDGRRLCQNCIDLAGRNEANYGEPSLAVLLGERLAEAEPELFVGAVALEPKRTDLTSDRVPKFTRGKQARRVNRLKGRKPKRSTVKYPRPFDDDLPSWWGTPATAGMSARTPWPHRGKAYISISATAAQ